MLRTAALVPVAGLSSRMGAFKPLMLLNGFPMIQLTVQTVLDAGVSAVCVVTGRESERVREALRDLGAPSAAALDLPAPRIHCVSNEDFASTDMLQSIKLGLRALLEGEQGGKGEEKIEAVFILPGDIPGIRPSTLGQLVSYAMEQEASSVVFPLYQGKSGHPVLIRRACFDAILHFEGAGGLREALKPFNQFGLEVSDGGVLLDADDPAAFAQLEVLVRRTKGVSSTIIKQLLDEAQTPQHIREHCAAVSELAVRMVSHLNNLGQFLDTELCRSAAALHDMHRLQEQHCEVGARTLNARGYDAMAIIVNEHMGFSHEVSCEFTESLIVCTADKLVKETRLVQPEERYAPGEDKYPETTDLGKRIRQDKRTCRELVDLYVSITGDSLFPLR